MSYDFYARTMVVGQPHDAEPWFGDEHPVLGSQVAGNVAVTAQGYTRCGNYTSNVVPIWARCLTAVQATGEEVHLSDLDGKRCGDIAMHLHAAVEWGVEHIDELRELNPKNGWGNAEGAVTYLWDIARHCDDHPDADLYISR